jgi:hypothetical protein
MIFCRHYISPFNMFLRKGKDPEPDPDPQHWLQHSLVWLYLVPKGWFYPLNNITYCCSIFLSVMLAWPGRQLPPITKGW